MRMAMGTELWAEVGCLASFIHGEATSIPLPEPTTASAAAGGGLCVMAAWRGPNA